MAKSSGSRRKGQAKGSAKSSVQALSRRPVVTPAGTRRLVHELEVHQLELEMQNAELREAHYKIETLLQTYTDLYDFAPIGYFSLDESGVILEVNLAGAALLGIERSQLVNRPLRNFISRADRPAFERFLMCYMGNVDKQQVSVEVLRVDGVAFSVGFQGASAATLREGKKWCRLAATDLSSTQKEENAQASTKGRTGAKHDLKTEINQRHKTEAALHRSESHYAHLLEQSRHMEEQLRDLSRQLLVSQEEERRRISRELHDEIIQTLVGINVHLASLSPNLPLNRQNFQKKIARTQKLVEKSVAIIHNFARELRPTVLDDLGLVAALRSFVRDFTNRTHIKVHFRACPQTDDLSGMKRTVLYRVAQSAMTNVHKHADATHVDLTISKIENALRMEIQDNGKSFDVARVLLAKRHKRLGLLGSRERIEMVGGIFTVNSNGGGTVVRADVPL